MDTTVRLGPLKFSLRATIDHHGPSIHSGHYTASINCCKKNIVLQRSHNYGVWNYWQQKLLYCICYTIWIDWHMFFGLEPEARSSAPCTDVSEWPHCFKWIKPDDRCPLQVLCAWTYKAYQNMSITFPLWIIFIIEAFVGIAVNSGEVHMRHWSAMYHYRFRLRLVASTAPNHYLCQCCQLYP